jgi:tocopherol O-methyltransferase
VAETRLTLECIEQGSTYPSCKLFPPNSSKRVVAKIFVSSKSQGYWTPETDNLTKEIAQVHLIELLLSRAGYPCTSEYAQQLGLPSHLQPASKSTIEQPRKLRVLDVGCGVGGTTRYLAEQRGWDVTGVTISSEQIKIAYELTDKLVAGANESSTTQPTATGKDRSGEKISVGKGSVQYIQLDAEKMGDHFPHGTFDIVWISEALSHLPNKDLFFRSSSLLLKNQSDTDSDEKDKGKLVIADWLKAPDLTQKQFDEDIEPIEVGMLLPPLDTMDGYLNKAEQNGLRIREGGEAMDISANVKRTW